MASVPANSDTLAGLPSSDTRTDNIHDPDDLMSRNSRVLNAWKNALLCNRIAVTDSTNRIAKPSRFARLFAITSAWSSGVSVQ
jgi:hypothetical protein